MLEFYEELQPRLRLQVRRHLGSSCESDVEHVLQDVWEKAAEAWTSSPHDHRAGQCVRHTAASAILEALSQLQRQSAPGASPHTQTRVDALRRLPSAQRLEVAVCWVLEATGQILGHRQVGTMDAEGSFHDLGLDTTDLRQLREQLTHITGLPLEPSSTSASSTPMSVAHHLLERLTPAEDDLPKQTDQFEAFYRGFHPRLRRYASRILGPGYNSDVDDVMQTVWIAVLGNWCRIRQMEYVEAYLFKVTRNESLRIRQATRRRYSYASPTEDIRLVMFAEHRMWLQPDEFDQVLQEEWLRRSIAEQIAPHLSRQQLAILLLAAAGHDNDVIADALGVAPATIRVQRYRLRRKLQTALPRAFWSNG
ncbi:sigma-70 family RNA polymerase sigma factor [Streptomyces phaeochromogenes]|uniref:sigma-70 family RNA polymerase sigma factor n=1 Tax=Streptomyces phaeochromogenes TaxID=1923 RepID=UPI002E2E76D0|nr:sigma-70 family RNA polymerase sigma factor [Streptomyces phaeochromogenes]